jgi:hypothetical protein
MGDLVAFRTAKNRLRAPPAVGGTAKILFFTGVRYERATNDASAVVGDPCAPKRNGKRDRIGGGKRPPPRLNSKR